MKPDLALKKIEYINDPSEPFAERFQAARVMLTEASENGKAAAKLWLTYRAIEGHMPRQEWENWVDPVRWHIEDEGRNLRWLMSMALAKAYYAYTLGRFEDGLLISQYAAGLWFEECVGKLWPSQVTNFLRASFMAAYHLYLNSDSEAEVSAIMSKAFAAWKDHVYALDPWKTPLRFSEMHDDRIVLQMFVYLGAKMGKCKIPRQAWANEDNVMPTGPTRLGGIRDPFYDIVKSMGQSLCPEKSIWG